MDETLNLIIDNGVVYTKAGYSVEEKPTIIFPTCLKRRRMKSYSSNNEEIFLVGQSALFSTDYGFDKIKYPFEKDALNNWDEAEGIWNYICRREFKNFYGQCNLIITEPPLFHDCSDLKKQREKIAEFFFETFDIPKLYIADQSILALYSSGKITGVSIDLGERESRITPIFEGYALEHAKKSIDVGGNDLTEYIQKCLIKNNDSYSKEITKEVARKIKEEKCYIPEDLNKYYLKYDEFSFYQLPDGKNITVRDEMIECPKILFFPSIIEKSGGGIVDKCIYSINKCDKDIWKDLFNSMVLSGGNSMYKGFPERFTDEIKKEVKEPMKNEIQIFASPERDIATWLGGKVLSSNSNMESMWYTKEEYDDGYFCGSHDFNYLHRKCF